MENFKRRGFLENLRAFNFARSSFYIFFLLELESISGNERAEASSNSPNPSNRGGLTVACLRASDTHRACLSFFFYSVFRRALNSMSHSREIPLSRGITERKTCYPRDFAPNPAGAPAPPPSPLKFTTMTARLVARIFLFFFFFFSPRKWVCRCSSTLTRNFG